MYFRKDIDRYFLFSAFYLGVLICMIIFSALFIIGLDLMSSPSFFYISALLIDLPFLFWSKKVRGKFLFFSSLKRNLISIFCLWFPILLLYYSLALLYIWNLITSLKLIVWNDLMLSEFYEAFPYGLKLEWEEADLLFGGLILNGVRLVSGRIVNSSNIDNLGWVAVLDR